MIGTTAQLRPEGSPDPTQPFPRQKPAFDPFIRGPQPPGTVPLTFEPTPEELASLYRALGDPDQSLFEVAASHNTTLPALTAWMARPDVAAQLDSLESAGARHARICAGNYLPRAASALISLADAYSHAERKVPLAPNTEAREQRRRQGETARRACWLLFRIARFYAGPPRPATGPSRTTKSGAPVVADSSSHSALSTVGTADLPSSRPAALPPLGTVADVLATLLAQAACGAGFEPAPDSASDSPEQARMPSPQSPPCGAGFQPASLPTPTPAAPTPPAARRGGTPSRPSDLSPSAPSAPAPSVPSPSASAPSPSGSGRGEGPSSAPRPVHGAGPTAPIARDNLAKAGAAPRSAWP